MASVNPSSFWSLIAALCSLLSSIDCRNLTHVPCDHSTISKLKYHLDSRQYAFCDSNGFTVTGQCPEGMIFDLSQERCLRNWEKQKRTKRQTAIVGIPCNENIDCQTTDGGAFCDATKRCDCLAAYINMNGYCWPKKNPGETCVYQDQCTGANQNSYCASTGTCMCLNNQRPTVTNDGPICLVNGECPTNGANPKLRDMTGVDVMCARAEDDCYNTESTVSSSFNTANDMYYCLCPLGDPDAFGCENKMGYCCPTRGAACIQPKEEGTYGGGGVASQTRWWYNSASGNCEALSYRGSGGNANNFQSKALCETYCKTACLRGNPAYTNPSGPAGAMSIQRCTVGPTSSCDDTNYYCLQTKTSFSMCCPKSSFICSARGGVASELSADGKNGGDPSYNVRTYNRWYFDGTRCVTFVYYGIGGNFNNFHTEAECRQYCSSTICKGGQPLRDSMGEMIRCGASCPAKYSCVDGYCCPSTDFICSQPQAVGGCSSFAERWWYNPATRSCEKFFYSGCQGNFNNFATYQECVEYCSASTAQIKCPQGEGAKDSNGVFIQCSGSAAAVINRCPSDYYCYFDGNRFGCCPTRTKTCSVDSVDEGTPCITTVTRWYYNTQTRLCEVFSYKGCDGNSNNFATKIDCQDYCGVGGCPDGGEPFRDTYNGQFRVCGSGGTDCLPGYSCSVVTMGTQTRRNHCCPTREYICSLGQDAGQRCGTTTLNRFFFNSVTRACEMFTYNGCAGNRNNFASLDQCITYCNSAGCQAGQVALQDANSRVVTTCDFNVVSSCPSGYTCVFSNTLRQGICCGSNAPVGSCPSGQSAYMDSFTSTPLQCQPNVDYACPNGIFCQFSFTMQNSFCCHVAGAQCPQGGSPYMEGLNNQPMQCTPGLPNACPSGYTCQTAAVIVGGITSTTGYCCGQSNLCGSGYTPYYLNSQPVVCVLNQFPSTCPSPYSCRQGANSQQSYCCMLSGQSTAVCALGKQPYLSQGSPTLCTQSAVSTGCPSGYTCDLYAASGSYYCCGQGIVVPTPSTLQPGCPAPYVLLQPVTPCSPGLANNCPPNYFCTYDSLGGRYVCCGSGTVIPTQIPQVANPCPNNGMAYVNPASGQAQVCVLGSASTGCPAPYGCAYSTTMRNYYCCTIFRPPVTIRPNVPVTMGGTVEDTYGCPRGTAYLYPGTRTPLACRADSGPQCPLGYTCQRSTRANAYHCCSTRFQTLRGYDMAVNYRG